MKVIVAGSRQVLDYTLVESALSHATLIHKIQITEIVEGEAAGVDTLAKQWAIAHNVPFKPFKADWSNITVPGAVVLTSAWGKKYNAIAGHNRNQLMADYGESLVAIWDSKSTGTGDMVKRAIAKGLPVAVYLITEKFSRLAVNLDGSLFCVTKNL